MHLSVLLKNRFYWKNDKEYLLNLENLPIDMTQKSNSFWPKVQESTNNKHFLACTGQNRSAIMQPWYLSILQNATNTFFKYLLEKLKLSFSLFLMWSLVTCWTLGQDGQFPPYKLWVDVVVVGSRWAGVSGHQNQQFQKMFIGCYLQHVLL